MIRDLGITFFACLGLAAFTAMILGLRSYRRACRTDPREGDPG